MYKRQEDDLLYLQEIEGRLAGIEDKLLERMSQPLYRAILSERKRLSAFHAYYEQMVDLGDEMQAYLTGLQAAEECAAWQFYTRRTERLHNHVETLREDLLHIRELYQSQLDVQQNKVMTCLLYTSNVITGTENRVLYGPGALRDEMAGVPVELDPLSFYQVNTAGAEQLYAVAREFSGLTGGETLLDLYCGAGTIGLSMADACGKLVGVEVVPCLLYTSRCV